MEKTGHNSFLPPLWFFTIALIVGCTWVAIQVQELVLFLVIAYCIAYVVNPAVNRLERSGFSRVNAVIAVFIGIVAIGGLLLVTIVPGLVDEFTALFQHLPSYIDTARERIIGVVTALEQRYPGKSAELAADIRDRLTPTGEQVRSVLSAIGSGLVGGISVTLFIANLLLLPFIAFYLSVDFESMHRSFLDWVPVRRRSAVERTAQQINRSIAAYLRGQLLVATALFIMYAIGLGALGLKLWFPVALIAGFGNLIPYIGTITGLILSVTMALVTHGTVVSVACVLGLFVLVSLVEGFILSPRILGEQLGLSPLTIMIVLIIGGTVAGLLGLFLAVPVAAALKVVAPKVYRTVVL